MIIYVLYTHTHISDTIVAFFKTVCSWITYEIIGSKQLALRVYFPNRCLPWIFHATHMSARTIVADTIVCH